MHAFRQLALRQDIHECSLLTKEHPANQPRYNLLTTPQVATIIIDEDAKSMTSDQNIRKVRHDGILMKIQEIVG